MKALELYHHGVKGQKWGVRRYQNYDGSRINKELDLRSDRMMLKGEEVKRVYVPVNNSDPNDYRNERLYVSDNGDQYVWDLNVNGSFDRSTKRMEYYKVNDRMRIAGERAINNILKDIGEKPLIPKFTEDGQYNDDFFGENDNRDFLNDDVQLGRRFIKRALEKGYDGVYDPLDSSIGSGYSYEAKIIFNKNKLTKVKDISVSGW